MLFQAIVAIFAAFFFFDQLNSLFIKRYFPLNSARYPPLCDTTTLFTTFKFLETLM